MFLLAEHPKLFSMCKQMALFSFPQSFATLARTQVATYVLQSEMFKLRYLQICLKNPPSVKY